MNILVTMFFFHVNANNYLTALSIFAAMLMRFICMYCNTNILYMFLFPDVMLSALLSLQ